jgi:hypothetical protein
MDNQKIIALTKQVMVIADEISNETKDITDAYGSKRSELKTLIQEMKDSAYFFSLQMDNFK